MKFGPENSRDIVNLKAYLHMILEKNALMKKAAELQRNADDMVWKTLEFRPKTVTFLMTREEIDQLTVESYNNLRNDQSPIGYCDCDGCVNGTGCYLVESDDD